MILRSFLRRRQIRRCIDEVGPLLATRYGVEEHYAPARIRATLDIAGVDRKLLMMACAMYASLADFSDWVRTSDEAIGRSWVFWSRRALRKEHDHSDLYRLLRREAAAVNEGSYRFLPRTEDPGPSFGSDSGSDFPWYR